MVKSTISYSFTLSPEDTKKIEAARNLLRAVQEVLEETQNNPNKELLTSLDERILTGLNLATTLHRNVICLVAYANNPIVASRYFDDTMPAMRVFALKDDDLTELRDGMAKLVQWFVDTKKFLAESKGQD
jgi:hypothetical protein